MIDQLIARHDELPALATEMSFLFFAMVFSRFVHFYGGFPELTASSV
jgi:hypothetical protein